MNRIQFTTKAFKTFVEDVKAPIKELVYELQTVMRSRTTVYVVTFWHVDSMGGWNWYPAEAKADAIVRRELWEKELRDESKQDGVVALFQINIPVAYAKNNNTINEYLEIAGDSDTFQDKGVLMGEYRQNMGSRTGY